MPAVRDRSGRLTELRTPSGRVVWGRSGPARARRQRMTAAGTSATVYVYDEIGYWGITAADFVPALDSLDATRIELRVNSPGGDVYEGIAIYEALLRHPAEVVAHVDGLAASIATVILAAADTVVMAPTADLMIHDAWSATVGDEADHLAAAAVLSQVSDNIASIYARRAGGEAKGWRKTMKAERWYTAAEAVDAGLADRVRDDDQGDDVEADLAAALTGIGPSLRAGLAQAIEDRRGWDEALRLAERTTWDGPAVAITEGLAS
jgi:ATP-dependent protease ClpP protease subunit